MQWNRKKIKYGDIYNYLKSKNKENKKCVWTDYIK